MDWVITLLLLASGTQTETIQSRTCTGSAIGAGCPGDLLMSNLFVQYGVVSGVGDGGQDCQQYLGPDYPQKCFVRVEPEYLSAIEAQCSGKRQCGYILAKDRDIDCLGLTAKSHFVVIYYHCVQENTSKTLPERTTHVTKLFVHTIESTSDSDFMDTTTTSFMRTPMIVSVTVPVVAVVITLFVLLAVYIRRRLSQAENNSDASKNLDRQDRSEQHTRSRVQHIRPRTSNRKRHETPVSADYDEVREKIVNVTTDTSRTYLEIIGDGYEDGQGDEEEMSEYLQPISDRGHYKNWSNISIPYEDVNQPVVSQGVGDSESQEYSEIKGFARQYSQINKAEVAPPSVYCALK